MKYVENARDLGIQNVIFPTINSNNRAQLSLKGSFTVRVGITICISALDLHCSNFSS